MLLKIKACFLLIGFYFFVDHSINAQDLRVADSLRSIYQADTLQGKARLDLLKNLSFNEVNDYNLSLKYADELIDLARQDNNMYYLAHGYIRKGNAEKLMGNLENALDAFFRTAEIANQEKLLPLEGSAYINIADIYSITSTHNNAMQYYRKAIAALRNSGDTIALASSILNAGEEYRINNLHDSALAYFKESGEIFEKANYLVGKAYSLGNTGMVYASQGKIGLAEENINKAIQILTDYGDYYPISVYLLAIAEIYLEKNDQATALNYAKRSLTLAQQYGLKEQIRDANLKLSELYEATGDQTTAYQFYKEYVVYRDSVKNIEAVEQMADLRTNYEVSQKQIEVDLLNEQRRTQRIIAIATGIALLLILVLAIGLYRRNTFIKKTNEIIAAEKDRSENLLLNILPEQTAQELKEEGKVKAQKFESVSVLFTDFKGFTRFSENLQPEELVERVDFYFSKFDAIMEEHGLEKIKTIGDAYMCAAGLPFPMEDHASRMTKAAMDIVRFVQESKDDPDNDQAHFDIRVGIHSGPVVAGVVGTKKFSYDIWGDTVNVASRMESNSEPGRINVSENTYQLIKDEFDCSFRGEIEAKNRGSLKMYFVEGRRLVG
ncbi:MAG: adenylate/guanylate cyclase domain-containing protein [Flavobacteriaceae bacterium]